MEGEIQLIIESLSKSLVKEKINFTNKTIQEIYKHTIAAGRAL